MDLERVRGYFNERGTVAHYARAAAEVGLWASEKLLFERYLRKTDAILDLGCGAGRVSFGLWESGFENVTGADLAEGMVDEARSIAEDLGCSVRFRVEDATALSCDDSVLDGVIFAFNGLMQIPGRDNRRRALREIARSLRPGGVFIFSTLDREDQLYSKVFADQSNFEHDLDRNPYLLEYGDRHFRSDHGTTFMHVPLRRDVAADLREAGFDVVEDRMRSEIARESDVVEDFAEDCRLWVARRAPV